MCEDSSDEKDLLDPGLRRGEDDAVQLSRKGDPGVNLRRIFSTAAAISTTCAAFGVALASPASAVTFNCEDIISASGTYVLTADIGSAATPCVTAWGIGLAASNIVLDLNGHTIWGNGPQANDDTANIGVWVTNQLGAAANTATVKNGTVTGFNVGVYLENVTNGTVQSMSLHDNIGPDVQGIYGEGLQVFQGGSHTITGNSVVHNGPFAGIDLYGPTSNNTVTNNSVQNNNIISDDHHGGSDLIMQDIGIWVISLTSNLATPTTNNNVANNSVQGNGLDGIQVANFTNGNFVRTNGVSNNGFGQPATNPFRDGDGIAIFGSFNTVQTNQVVSNGGNGIGVEGSGAVNGKSNTITGNQALLNGSGPKPQNFDLFDNNTGCDANVWLLNTFITRNQTCIH
jgi:parallel beta-helix repeat protein